MKNDLKFFIEFTKKDNDKREVSGYASTPAIDSQGEIVEREAIEKALPGYLGEVDQKSGKFRYGNIREMHQLSAVGKTIQARIDDKGLYITGKVVDDNAWKKVKEGVYAGFSIGGKILQASKNRIKAIKLTEISLVDRPANPEAVFAMVKVDSMGKAVMAQGMPEATPKPQDYSIDDASYILDLARGIRMLLNTFRNEGRSTIELSTALTALKKLATKVLSGTDAKKFNNILYGIDFEELNKIIKPEEARVNKTTKKADIKMYINTNWTQGYFEDLKKVLG